MSDSAKRPQSKQQADRQVDKRDKNPKIQRNQIGKFQLIRMLGEGGMGTVYLAQDSDAKREVALKLPKFSKSNFEQRLHRFRREARTAARLSHPNICPIYEMGEINGQFFISLQYIEGVTLDEHVRTHGPLNSETIARIIQELASAVDAAHEAGVIHRDLKPENIMIDVDGDPIVMDFGLAQMRKIDKPSVTQSGGFVGTPAYSSPEQLKNAAGKVDHRTDVYSLGVVMYVLLCGQLPYETTNAVNLIAQVLTQDPPSPQKVNRDACPLLSKIAMKAMRRDVSIRYQSMQELADSLSSYLFGDEKSREDASFQLDDNPTARTPKRAGLAKPGGQLSLTQQSEVVNPSVETPISSEPTRSKASKQRSRSQSQKKEQNWITHPLSLLSASSIVLLSTICLGFMYSASSTETSGTLKLERDWLPPDVQITIDGEEYSIEDLDIGVELSVGEHALVFAAANRGRIEAQVKVSRGQILDFRMLPGYEAPDPEWKNQTGSDSNLVQNAASAKADSFENLLPPLRAGKPDIVFEDFESGVYGEWQQLGASFGMLPQPVKGDLAFSRAISSGLNGKFLADSYFNSDRVGHSRYEGSLVSPAFLIERQWINFLVAGGGSPSASVRLMVNDKLVRSSTGDLLSQRRIMHPTSWYVGDLLGQEARIEIVDSSSDPDGHIAADLFVFSDVERHAEMHRAIRESISENSVEFEGTQYFIGDTRSSREDAEVFAEYLDGHLLTINTIDEFDFISESMPGPVWLGIRNSSGRWLDVAGGNHTRGPWLYGAPSHPNYYRAYLDTNSQFVWSNGEPNYFIVELGASSSAQTPWGVGASENSDAQRDLAMLLLKKRAHLVVIVDNQYFWLSPGDALPESQLEIKQIKFSEAATIADQEVDFSTPLLSIESLETKDGDRSILKLLRITPNLQQLIIDGGSHDWSDLAHLPQGHALKQVILKRTQIDANQMEPIFGAKALEKLEFYSTSMGPGIGNLLIKQKESLQELRLNGTGFRDRGEYRNLQELTELRLLMLYSSGITDRHFRFFKSLTKLKTLDLGYNPGINGSGFRELAPLQQLESIRISAADLKDNLGDLPMFPKLKSLDLWRDKINSDSLAHLATYPNLRVLSLHETNVTDDGILHLVGMGHLEKITLQKTQVSNPAVQRLKNENPALTVEISSP